MSHRDQQDKWEAMSSEMRRWNPPLNDPTQINIPMSASARIRFEPHSRDAINSRLWESLQYDTKAPNSEDIKKASSPIFQDMNPISSRTATQNYNQQAQFFPDPPRPPKKGGDQPVPEPTLSPGLISNPYLQRLDPINDARNIPREMRSAVYENNSERETDAARLLTERQFSSRFLPDGESAKVNTLKAYELLRPKTDDYNKVYRN